MKLVLVRPPFYSLFGLSSPKMKTYPLNLLYLATYVNQNSSWEAEICDGEDLVFSGTPATSNIDPELAMNDQIPHMQKLLDDPNHEIWNTLLSQITLSKPDIVGITCNSGNMDTVSIITRGLKQSGIPVVLGGSHPTALPAQSMLYTSADMAVMGEGEVALVSLLKTLETGSDLSLVESLAWISRGNAVINSRAKLIDDIDSLPIPDRSLINRGNYFGEVIMTGRGCPFNCAYCASRNIWGKKTRLRSVDSIIEELSTIKTDLYKLQEKHIKTSSSSFPSGNELSGLSPGMWVVKVVDDTFTVVKSRTMKLLDAIIENHLNCFEFTGGVRADTLDSKLVRKMKQANFKRVTLGVESGSPKILKFIRKGETNEDVIRAVKMLRDEGIMSHAFFMIGFPGETREDIEMSKQLILEARPDHVEVNMVTPYPGTDIFKQIIKEDPIEINRWYRWFHQGMATHSDTLGYDLDHAYRLFLEFAREYHLSQKPNL